MGQSLPPDALDRLSLSEIDDVIAEIEQRIDLVRFGSTDLNGIDDKAPAKNTTETETFVSTSRSSQNLLCFADSDHNHRTPEALDAYFEKIATVVRQASNTVSAFATLTADLDRGSCPDYLSAMLASVEADLGSVSRFELSDLVYHLETCWPDDGVTESDNSPFDIDARYNRARNSLNLLRGSELSLRKAKEWCN
ncbi:MAG: hypothetical protein AAFR45_02070 [Pseudomonadota bacterium]